MSKVHFLPGTVQWRDWPASPLLLPLQRIPLLVDVGGSEREFRDETSRCDGVRRFDSSAKRSCERRPSLKYWNWNPKNWNPKNWNLTFHLSSIQQDSNPRSLSRKSPSLITRPWIVAKLLNIIWLSTELFLIEKKMFSK